MGRVHEGYEYSSVVSNLVMGLVGAASVLALLANAWVLAKVRIIGHTGLSKKMIAMLAMMDMLASLNLLCMGLANLIIGLSMGYPKVYDTPWFCPVLGSLANFLTGLAWVAVAILALDRFSIVFFERRLSIRAGWIAFYFCGLCFIIPTVATSTYLQNGFRPDPTYTHCWFANSYWADIATNVMSILFSLSMLTITIVYVSVALHYFRKPTKTNEINYAKQVAIRALIILTFYYCSIAFKIASIILYGIDQRIHPFFLHILSPVGLASSIAINPILALSSYRGFFPSFISPYRLLKEKIFPAPKLATLPYSPA
ncbi:hypothetical protein L0F63_006902, partial [Massospora cicadina]